MEEKKEVKKVVRRKRKLSPKKLEIAEQKKLFRRYYPEYGTVGGTLKVMGYRDRRTFYNWLEQDSAFRDWYEKEGQPNRRDVIATQIFRAASGKKRISHTQFLSAIAFLKAVESGKKHTPDDLAFTEKTQIDLQSTGVTFRLVEDGNEQT